MGNEMNLLMKPVSIPARHEQYIALKPGSPYSFTSIDLQIHNLTHSFASFRDYYDSSQLEGMGLKFEGCTIVDKDDIDATAFGSGANQKYRSAANGSAPEMRKLLLKNGYDLSECLISIIDYGGGWIDPDTGVTWKGKCLIDGRTRFDGNFYGLTGEQIFQNFIVNVYTPIPGSKNSDHEGLGMFANEEIKPKQDSTPEDWVKWIFSRIENGSLKFDDTPSKVHQSIRKGVKAEVARFSRTKKNILSNTKINEIAAAYIRGEGISAYNQTFPSKELVHQHLIQEGMMPKDNDQYVYVITTADVEENQERE